MRPRHPFVDLGDHAVPIEQQIERDHRRDDNQRERREQRLAARENEPSKVASHAGRLRREPAELLLRLGQFLADELAEPGLALRCDDLLDLVDIAGQPLDEGGQLLRRAAGTIRMTRERDQRDAQ